MYPYFWLNFPKANFPKNRVIVSSCNTECYVTDLDFWLKNPKANFPKNRATISSCNTECYETDLDFWLKNPKANFKVEAERRSLRVSFLESSNRGPKQTQFQTWSCLAQNGFGTENEDCRYSIVDLR
jgi:hypothetical protein